MDFILSTRYYRELWAIVISFIVITFMWLWPNYGAVMHSTANSHFIIKQNFDNAFSSHKAVSLFQVIALWGSNWEIPKEMLPWISKNSSQDLALLLLTTIVKIALAISIVWTRAWPASNSRKEKMKN